MAGRAGEFPTLQTFPGIAANGGAPPIALKGSDHDQRNGKWFNQAKGYGFFQPGDDSRDAIVHISAVERSGLATLNEGQTVTFELVPGRNGRMAADIKLAGLRHRPLSG